MKEGKKKKERDVDKIPFNLKSKDFELSGDPDNSDVIEIAKREQILRYVWRYGWLVLGIIATILKVFDELIPIALLMNYFKSIIFKHW